MNILFIGLDIDVFNLFRLIINYKYECEMEHVFNTTKAVEVLGERKFNLIIFLIPQDEPQVLFDYLKKRELKYPLIFAAWSGNPFYGDR